MSNILKSKVLFVTMIVAAAFVGLMLVASTASASYTHSTTLKFGSRGAQVTALQGALGVSPMSGYFGSITKAAVMAYQSANGLTADGVVGPMTGAKIGGAVSGNFPAGCTSAAGYSTLTGLACTSSNANTFPAGCSSAAGYSSTTGMKCDGSSSSSSSSSSALTGEGSVKDFSVGSPEESDVSEDQSDRELVSWDLELNDDGSLKLDRFDLYMGQDNTVTASNKPWDYFKSATLWVGGKNVASMDVDSSSDWSEYDTGTLGTTSQEYRLRFSGVSTVLPSDEVTSVSVSFDTLSNIDSADEDAVWQFGVETDSFRFEDATGFIFTDGEDLADSFSFDTADLAALSLSSSSTDPEAKVVEVDDASDTNGVVLGVFQVEETADVAVNVTEMTVTLVTSDTITDMVKTLYLYDGTTLIGQEAVTGLVTTFDNIDWDISGDEKVKVTVKADLDDTNSQVRYQDGDTLQVSAINLTAYEDEFSNDEGDITESGSYAGNTHEFRTKGIIVAFDDSSYLKSSSTTSGVNETVEFTLEFDVTAFGDDMYIDETCTVEPTTFVTSSLSVSLDGDTSGDNTSCTSFTSTADDTGSAFEVLEGQTEHFTVTILGNGGEAGSAGTSVTFQARIENIGYNVGADGAGDTSYAFELDNYESSSVTVFDR